MSKPHRAFAGLDVRILWSLMSPGLPNLQVHEVFKVCFIGEHINIGQVWAMTITSMPFQFCRESNPCRAFGVSQDKRRGQSQKCDVSQFLGESNPLGALRCI